MTEHPEELLAGYVEGTLDTPDRAMVEAHLVACDRCTAEIELATRARAALRELADVTVPAGVLDLVLAEARGEPAPEPVRAAEPLRLRRAGYWPEWLPKALAAAAGVVAVVLVAGTLVPRLTGEDGTAGGGAAPAMEAVDKGAGAPAPVPDSISLETSNVDYDGTELSRLASETARSYVDYAERAGAGDGSGVQPLECVARGASLTESDTAVRVIAATFEGAAAYIGVYIESPTPGSPPTRIIIWTVSREDCTTLSYSEGRV